MNDVATAFAVAGAGASWLWDQIGKDIVSKARGAIKAEWQRFNWPEAEARYRSRLRGLYCSTRLLGYPKPIEIENIYTDVYVLDKLSAIRRYSIEELQNDIVEKRKFSSEDEKRRPILDLALKEKRLYLLGKPGAGKTTFLRYLTLQACAGKISETPIFVELKDWAASGLDLVTYMVRQFEICAFPEALTLIRYLLENGYALVLFDGLDEVNQEGEQRSKMIRILRDFARQYPEVRICLTCRIAASDYSFEQFTYLEIADFTENQVQQFARKWYQEEPEKGERFLEELSKPEHRGLRELTCTPILLALLCLAFDQTLEFPPNRTELYKEALDALLKKWDASRIIRRDNIYQNLTSVRKENMLAQIAAVNFEQNRYLLPERLIAGQIAVYLNKLPAIESPDEADGEAVLKAIEAQHGILVERAHHIYSFSHLTFQEYLTARHIVENGSSVLERLIRNHNADKHWQEVFLMTASLLPDAGEFFEIFLRANADLICRDLVCFDLLKQAYEITRPKIQEQGKYNNEIILITFVHKLFTGFRTSTNSSKLDINIHTVISRALTLAQNRIMARIIARSRTYGRDLALDRAHDRDQTRAWALNQVINQASILRESHKGARILDNALAGDLSDILMSHYGIETTGYQENGVVGVKQFQNFNLYLIATELIFECLKLAVVPDRERILSGMFLPKIE